MKGLPADLLQGALPGGTQLIQPVFDLALHPAELLLPADDGLPLAAELILHAVHVPVPEKVPDLPQGEIQRPEIADGVEHFELAGAVVAIAGGGVGVFRGEETQGLVVPQGPGAEMEHPGHLADGKEIPAAHVPLSSVGSPARPFFVKMAKATTQMTADSSEPQAVARPMG